MHFLLRKTNSSNEVDVNMMAVLIKISLIVSGLGLTNVIGDAASKTKDGVTSSRGLLERSNSTNGFLQLIPGKYQDTVNLIDRPFFDDVYPHNVSAIVGQTAILHCRVKDIGQRTVSWMRKRDLHVLTSNIFTYTGDARFSVIHPDMSDEWNLKIEYVQKRDSGVYSCHVNTEPKISLELTLYVQDKPVEGFMASDPSSKTSRLPAQAKIHGPEDIYVKKGSTISLTCSVSIHSTPPISIQWYHGHVVVDFDSPRGGISLETEKTEAGTTSKLLVTRASLLDSGNYTCVPNSAIPTSVRVHVLNGEHPAAMQHGEHNASSTNIISTWLTCYLVLLCWLLS